MARRFIAKRRPFDLLKKHSSTNQCLQVVGRTKTEPQRGRVRLVRIKSTDKERFRRQINIAASAALHWCSARGSTACVGHVLAGARSLSDLRNCGRKLSMTTRCAQVCAGTSLSYGLRLNRLLTRPNGHSSRQPSLVSARMAGNVCAQDDVPTHAKFSVVDGGRHQAAAAAPGGHSFSSGGSEQWIIAK